MLDRNMAVVIPAGLAVLGSSLALWRRCLKETPNSVGFTETEADELHALVFIDGKSVVLVRTDMSNQSPESQTVQHDYVRAGSPSVICGLSDTTIVQRFLGAKQVIVREAATAVVTSNHKDVTRALDLVTFHIIESARLDLIKNAGMVDLAFDGAGDLRPVDAMEVGAMPEQLGQYSKALRWGGRAMRQGVDVFGWRQSPIMARVRINHIDSTDEFGNPGKVKAQSGN